MSMLAGRLFFERSRRGYSLSDLSKMSGVNRQTIHRYETGSKPSHDNLVKIANALDLTVEKLLTDPTGKDSQDSPYTKADYESRLKEVRKFTPKEMETVILVIDQIIEKRKVTQND